MIEIETLLRILFLGKTLLINENIKQKFPLVHD